MTNETKNSEDWSLISSSDDFVWVRDDNDDDDEDTNQGNDKDNVDDTGFIPTVSPHDDTPMSIFMGTRMTMNDDDTTECFLSFSNKNNSNNNHYENNNNKEDDDSKKNLENEDDDNSVYPRIVVVVTKNFVENEFNSDDDDDDELEESCIGGQDNNNGDGNSPPPPRRRDSFVSSLSSTVNSGVWSMGSASILRDQNQNPNQNRDRIHSLDTTTNNTLSSYFGSSHGSGNVSVSTYHNFGCYHDHENNKLRTINKNNTENTRTTAAKTEAKAFFEESQKTFSLYGSDSDDESVYYDDDDDDDDNDNDGADDDDTISSHRPHRGDGISYACDSFLLYEYSKIS